MRIGVLTLHKGTNYGGILQCYALQKVLRAYGHSVELIDYIPKQPSVFTKAVNKLKTLDSFRSLWSVVRQRILPARKTMAGAVADQQALNELFSIFRRKHISVSPSLNCRTIGEYANAHYDAVIVGSDQVWTSLYDSDAVYFVGWVPEFNGVRISYAACSAHKFVRGRRKNMLADLLGKFSLITVRDDTTAELVENITGSTPMIAPDPTELHDFQEFVSEGKTEPKEDYILAYILGVEIAGGHRAALDRVKAQAGNIPVYAILSTKANDVAACADKVLTAVSPEEWVRLIAGAKAVYTDSFHAILFAMKFNVPFAGYYRDIVRSSRLIYLQKKYGLNNIVPHANQITVNSIKSHPASDNILCNI